MNGIKIICFLFLLLPCVSYATPDNSTLRVVADSMDCDQIQGICIATGNAFAERPNDPEKRTIRAHKFTVHFTKADKDKSSSEESPKTELHKLEADGQVVITDKDTIIRSDKAIYHHDPEVVELFDNVHLTQGANQLNGSYGHADLKSKKYRVTNDKDQVHGLFVKQT